MLGYPVYVSIGPWRTTYLMDIAFDILVSIKCLIIVILSPENVQLIPKSKYFGEGGRRVD